MRSRYSIILFLCLILVPAAFAAMQSWEKPVQPPAWGDLTAAIPHPLDASRVLVSSKHQIYENTNRSWKKLWHASGSNMSIHRLVSFTEIPNALFVLTNQGVFRGNFGDGRWQKIYQGTNDRTASVLSFAVLPEDPDHWFAGTEDGLFESDDAGRTWFRFSGFAEKSSISVILFANDRLFVGTSNILYVSHDLIHFHPVFSLSLQSTLQDEALEDAAVSNPEDFENNVLPQLFILISSQSQIPTIWIGTKKGVFQSGGYGRHWKALSSSGLRNTEIRHLVYSEKSKILFAGTSNGIYQYHPEKNHWEELFRGLAHTQTEGLTLLSLQDKEELLAITPDGFLRYSIVSGEMLPDSVSNFSSDHLLLFRKLIRLEPTAREIHQAVVDYGNLSNRKIKRWHAESRLQSLLPSFSFGRDFSTANNVDIDRGSTSEPDQFILGPSDTDNGWDMDVSWDLGDLIWSSSQTSIDSRDKLMVELRNDLLAEATRVYYERRRLQTEIVFVPAASEHEHIERLIRMDELTSLLDGMSDGYLSGQLRKIYRKYPDLEKLWTFTAADQGEAVHTQHQYRGQLSDAP